VHGDVVVGEHLSIRGGRIALGGLRHQPPLHDPRGLPIVRRTVHVAWSVLQQRVRWPNPGNSCLQDSLPASQFKVHVSCSVLQQHLRRRDAGNSCLQDCLPEAQCKVRDVSPVLQPHLRWRNPCSSCVQNVQASWHRVRPIHPVLRRPDLSQTEVQAIDSGRGFRSADAPTFLFRSSAHHARTVLREVPGLGVRSPSLEEKDDSKACINKQPTFACQRNPYVR
jgi:hypothetical protein